MKANIYLLLSLILSIIGMGLIVYVFQYPSTIDNTPEFIYDLNSVGLFIFISFPLLLVIGVSKLIPHNRYIDLFRYPSAISLFASGFNMIKEVTGSNQNISFMQDFLFWFFLLITILSQYARINKKRRTK